MGLSDYSGVLGRGFQPYEDEDELLRRQKSDVDLEPVQAPTLLGGDSGGAVPGSNFVNYANYYNANKEKAQGMAQGLADDARKKQQGVRDDANKGWDAFGWALTAGAATPYGNERITDGTAGAEGGPDRLTNGGATAQRQQGLTGTSQRAAPPGAITPQEASARAGQTYGGPMGLSDYTGLLERATEADSDAAALGTDEGRQALLGTKNGTGLKSGSSRLDAAFAGTAGAGRFDALAKKFGGNADMVNDFEKRAGGAADNQKDIAKASGEAYAKDLKAKKTSDEANAGAAKTKAEKKAARQKALQKSKTFQEYQSRDLANWVKRAGTGLDPINALQKAGGGRGWMDGRTDSYEDQFGHPIGDSSSTNVQDVLGELDAGTAERVYNALTQADLNRLAGASRSEIGAYIRSTLAKLNAGWNPEEGE